MQRILELRLALFLPALLAAFLFAFEAAPLAAQDDPNQIPLGDVARSLRKEVPPPKLVIDDDNLSSVMRQAETERSSVSALTFLMEGERADKALQVSAPEVSCSLAFNANAKALLSSNQYAQMDLPQDELSKLAGPAAIEDDALTVSVFNGTNWHLSEITVALTTISKPEDASMLDGSLRFVPASDNNSQESTNRPDGAHSEKQPDVTMIYRMRAAAAPWSTTVFRAPLNEEIPPGKEWHWAIVQARGYPPETYTATATPPAAPNVSLTVLPVSAELGRPAQIGPIIPPTAASPSVASLPQAPR